MAKPVRVLVLCSGNIGRSPLAAALLRSALAERLGVEQGGLVDAGFDVSSAGTAAPEGHVASKRGMAFAVERGLDLSDHRARTLTTAMAEEADIIYGFDRSHVGGVGAVSVEAVSKTALWEGEGSEIPDPHHESDEFFREVAVRIEAAVPVRVNELLAMWGNRNR